MDRTCASAIIIGVMLKFNCSISTNSSKLVRNYFKPYVVRDFAPIKRFGLAEIVLRADALEIGRASALQPILLKGGKKDQSDSILQVIIAYAKTTPKECVIIQSIFHMVDGKKHVASLKCPGVQTILLAFIRT